MSTPDLLSYDHGDARLRAWGFESDKDRGIPLGAWPTYEGDDDERRGHLAAFIAAIQMTVFRAKGKLGAVGRVIIERRGVDDEGGAWETVLGREMPSEQEVEAAARALGLVHLHDKASRVAMLAEEHAQAEAEERQATAALIGRAIEEVEPVLEKLCRPVPDTEGARGVPLGPLEAGGELWLLETPAVAFVGAGRDGSGLRPVERLSAEAAVERGLRVEAVLATLEAALDAALAGRLSEQSAAARERARRLGAILTLLAR